MNERRKVVDWGDDSYCLYYVIVGNVVVYTEMGRILNWQVGLISY